MSKQPPVREGGRFGGRQSGRKCGDVDDYLSEHGIISLPDRISSEKEKEDLIYRGPTDNRPHRHIFVHFDGLQVDLPHGQEVGLTSKSIKPK